MTVFHGPKAAMHLSRKLLILALLPAFLASTSVWSQPIYKVVDEDGNVTYTDQRPDEEAEPMDLPELNVLEGREMEPPITRRETGEEREPLELRFVSPQPEEHILGTGNSLTAVLESNIAIPPSALVVFYLDGQAQEPVQSMSMSFEQVDRGEHSIRAELQTPSGRVLASTESVTFYMRQASRQHPAPP
ncbi:DUF4124 domain-containing protein [Wenzhouxiangella marina]|uniref:DUF4124 domain-containing protein n=1 Tax=Wenzhouxiangella marina TaxID=1579979 RepID=A0A0K0XZR1_9GAMM|nr:DUF4124 domain-containing protein [Wenzhouxiangella marina]AKS43127.1 hypothetical protein WM2015_2770 [Wenzhouxiangella marina]MBB6087188.1 hypothetical protein [Wenzhouxiangella marina]